MPNTYVLNQVEIDRMIVAAVGQAVKAARAEITLTKADVEDAVKKGVDDLLRYAFDIPAGNDQAVIDLRGDIKALRDALSLRRAAAKHGTLAVAGALAVGFVTLIVMWARGGFK